MKVLWQTLFLPVSKEAPLEKLEKFGQLRAASLVSGPFWLAGVRSMKTIAAETRKEEKKGKKRGNIRVRGCIVALMAASIKHPRACSRIHACSATLVYSATIYVDNFEMESDT